MTAIKRTHDELDDHGDCTNDTESNNKSKKCFDFQTKRIKLNNIRIKIGSTATIIVSNPEHNITRLRELLKLLDRTSFEDIDEDDRHSVLEIHRLLTITALEIFKDTIPSYRISEKTNEEEDSKPEQNKGSRFRGPSPRMKRETLQQKRYERSFCQLYKFYLQRLERMVECVKKQTTSTFFDTLVQTQTDRVSLAKTALNCLGRLVVAHPHFNFRDQIIKKLVEFNSQTKFNECANIAHEHLCNLLKQDKLGEVSFEVVKVVCELSKTRKLSLSPLIFETLLSLRLVDVRKAHDEEKARKKEARLARDHMVKLSRKEKKRNKKMKQLSNHLLEAEAHNTMDQKLKYHSGILKKLFVTYFRLLKYHEEMNEDSERGKFEKVIPPILEGLAKFAGQIDVNLCNDIFPLLHNLLEDRSLSSNHLLHCLRTVFVMLRNMGSEINIDPQSFYRVFYSLLESIEPTKMAQEEFSSFLECIDLLLIKRSKQISSQRAAAFARRLLTLSLSFPVPSVLNLLESIRALILQHPSTAALLDSSNCANYGAGVYDPQLSDPDHSYADSSVAWELHLLRSHHEKSVIYAVNNLIRDLSA